MHLLQAPRLIQDEGLRRLLLIAGRLLRDGDARARIFAIAPITSVGRKLD
jgi:hypothetical protein